MSKRQSKVAGETTAAKRRKVTAVEAEDGPDNTALLVPATTSISSARSATVSLLINAGFQYQVIITQLFMRAFKPFSKRVLA